MTQGNRRQIHFCQDKIDLLSISEVKFRIEKKTSRTNHKKVHVKIIYFDLIEENKSNRLLAPSLSFESIGDKFRISFVLIN